MQSHALPDSNVRPAPPHAQRGAAPTPVRRLAHSVLLSKLVRVLLLVAVSPMSACIIPAGPEFQDPPGVPDSPPFLWAASPDEGTTVVSATAMFSVTPGDYNLDDTLFVKWISEKAKVPRRVAVHASGSRKK